MSLDAPEAVAISPEKNPRRVSLDLRQADFDKLGDIKPGDTIQLSVVGDCCSISMHEPYNDGEEAYVGYLDVEVKRLKIENRSTFDDLSEDD